MNFYTSVQKMGNNILFRGYKDGRRIQKKIPFAPHLYVSSHDGSDIALDGTRVKRIEFDNIRDAQNHIKTMRDVEGYDIYGTTDFVAQFIQQEFPGEIRYNSDIVNTVSLDIEVFSEKGFPHADKAEWPIDAVTLKSSLSNFYFVFTTLDANIVMDELIKKDIRPGDIRLKVCETEEDLIIAMLAWWNDPKWSPDIITGWNIRGFDVPYIINRTKNLFSESYAKKWSPWGIIKESTIFIKGQEMKTYDMLGISQLDYMDAFKKFAYSYGPQENYKLDHIAYVVLDERKMSYDEYSGLRGLRSDNPGKYLAYNIKDTWIVSRLEDKLGLIDLIMATAFKGGVNFNDCFGTTRIWDTIIYRQLMDQNIIVPPSPNNPKEAFVGGYVKDPQVGMHDNIVSFDLNSLYPNIIIQYNMSPETIVDESYGPLGPTQCLKDDFQITSDYAVAANGVQFRKDKQGIIPSIIVDYYAERKEIKDNMLEAEKEKQSIDENNKKAFYSIEKKIARLNNKQMTIKILLNSLFGALSNVWFRYFDLRVAEAITLSGQLAILTAEKSINDFLQKTFKDRIDRVIAIDTDSVYVNMSDVVKMRTEDEAKFMSDIDFLDVFADKVMDRVISKGYENMFDKMNAYTPRMVMGREVIANRGFWTAKKRYVLNVHDSEGVRYSKPKLKIMGIEAIKSSTPEKVREWLKKCFEIIIENDEDKFRRYVKDCRREYSDWPPEDLAAPRGVSNVHKYYDKQNVCTKGTPQNSRAALTYNHAIQKAGLTDKYELIGDGDKMKYFHLVMPNPTFQKVIGFPEVFPRELNLEDCIDRDLQFTKTFTDVLDPILKAIDWTLEEKSTLEEFFI